MCNLNGHLTKNRHAKCGKILVYFIKDKKYTQNQKKVTTDSDRYPEAASGLIQRTVSCLQDRLRTGGPKQETLPSSDTLQLCLQFPTTTPSTTPVYNSKILLLLLLPITAEDPPTTSTATTAVTKVIFAFRAKNFEKYHFKNH